MNYCPLNIYSGYTFLSSTLKVEDIFKICEKNNYPYFGLCDELNMHAYGDIIALQNKYKVKPIYGATIKYLVNDEHPLLVCLYCTSEISYRNLIKIISLYPEGITSKEFTLLKKELIAIVPTISNNEIKTLLQDHDLVTLEKELSAFKDGFLSFYLGIEIYQENDLYLINLLREFARNNNYQTVAFNKHLYLSKKDAIGLTILKAIKNDARITIKEEDGPYFFLNEAALNKLYTKQELSNSITIANNCSKFNFFIKRGKLLNFDIPNKKEYIYNKCLSSLKEKNLFNENYISRVNYELDIIEKMGYLDYFLIVEDYVKYCKNNSIPVGPGRGSSAGSLVSYLLNITEIDSCKYDLLFERFLNPERISMPDIDIDFADYRRDDVVKYIFNKYGNNKCANIVTFQTLGAKGSIRDIGRIYSINASDISYLTNAIGKNKSLADAYKKSDEFKVLLEDDYYLNIVRLAKKIEGLPRQEGLHAAGIIINDENLFNSIPVTINSDGTLVSQFEAPLLEQLGYLKMDILGLTNLTIIESMEKYIRHYYDKNFNIKSISLNDEKTFSILNKGLTCGLFQLESVGITKALKNVVINSFDDLVAILALYRPGPMDNIPTYSQNKNTKRKIDYLDPILEKILAPTYGVIIYQEQIMQIVQLVASFSLGKADLFRRAISKKDSSKLIELKDDFISGAIKNGFTNQKANEIYDLIFKFANYGFNKSHSVSYAVISYQMAYIKANYPTCYYACLLNHLPLNDPRMNLLFKELNYFNINLKLPSINKSSLQYVIEDNSLYIPFSSIKGIDKNILLSLNKIITNHIDSFSTFMKFAHEENIPEEAVINLINAGCFDEFNKTRVTLRHSITMFKNYYSSISSEGMLTQEELMLLQPIIQDEEEDESLKYELEFNTLGLLLSGSLLNKYKNQLVNNHIRPINELINNKVFSTQIGAIIKKVKIIKTKKNENMASVILQDDSTIIEGVIFPRTYAQYMHLLKVDNALLIKGYFQYKDEEISFICNDLIKLEEEK